MKSLLKQLGLTDLYCVDFETFYDDQLSLRKMATTEYIVHPEFELQLASVQKLGWAKPRVFVGKKAFVAWAKTVNWAKSGFLAHHTQFDGLIASHHCGIKPAFYFDTLSMARPIMPVHVGGSLKAVTEAFGRKGKKRAQALVNVKGKRLADFSKAELAELKAYAGDDVEDTWFIFEKMLPFIPFDELRLIDATIKMYAQPTILIDGEATAAVNEAETAMKAGLLDKLKVDRTQLTSNEQFVELLRAAGVEPPTKISPRTGKVAYALSKQDLAFKDLLKHKSKKVRELVEARLAVKTSIVETRSDRMTQRSHIGAQPVYLKYWGAKTGRWCMPGDAEVLTPSGWVAMCAWNGEPIVQYDSGRLSWAAATMSQFPYAGELHTIAGEYVRGAFTPEHRIPRFTSQGAFAVSTASDIHGKNICVPTAGTLEAYGVPWSDAEIRLLVALQADGSIESLQRPVRWKFRKRRKLKRLTELLREAGIPFSTFQCKVETAVSVARKDVPDYWWDKKHFGPWVLSMSTAQREVFLNELAFWDGVNSSATTRFSTASTDDAVWVQTVAHITNYTSCISTTTRAHIPKHRDKHHVSVRPVSHGRVRANNWGVDVYNGTVYCPTVPTGLFLVRYRGAVHVTGNSGGDKMNYQNLGRGSDLRTAIHAPPGHTLLIADLSQIEARLNAWHAGQQNILDAFANGDDVYAITASSIYGRPIDKKKDPEERFVGKVAVLALGYQAGAARFADMLRIGAFGPPIDISDSLAKDIVRAWRAANPFIVANWKRTNNNAKAAFIGETQVQEGVLMYEGFPGKGVTHMPGGTYIRYDRLRVDEDDGAMSYANEFRMTKDGPKETRQKLYGGLLTENNIQGLARRVIADHTLQLLDDLKAARLAMSTHDEVVMVVPDRSANKALAAAKKIMSTPPAWAPDLPLAVDAHLSKRYDK